MFLTNWHGLSSSDIPCHGVMRTRCEPDVGLHRLVVAPVTVVIASWTRRTRVNGVYVPHMTTVVSVHSFRGGTGKSNTTSNVAANLAALGHRVGVIDCDIQSPGIHVLFGFDETLDRTLNDYLVGDSSYPGRRSRHHRIACRLSTAVSPGGSLHLVPSSMKPGDIARILRDGYDGGVPE